MAKPRQTYAGSGVDYSAVDPIKILAQKRAAQTAKSLSTFSAEEMALSRGESAYVWKENGGYRAFVIEGLGTKNLIADSVREFSGKSHYQAIAQDAIAMIVNDLIVVGARPQVINAYFAVGDSQWMRDKERASDLINGWADACESIGASWGGGETPILKDIIAPATIDIAGSAIGSIKPNQPLVLGDNISSGDAIVLIESSGIHANGVSFVRALARQQKDIYKSRLSDGRSFGEALLTPSRLYVNLVSQLLDTGLDIHYMVNITGHGWRKLMRATKLFSYVVNEVPSPPTEFEFIQKNSGVDDKEMYGTFNMGAGYGVYLPKEQAQQVVDIAAKQGFKAWIAGQVESGPRRVIIKPKGITFDSDSLEVR